MSYLKRRLKLWLVGPEYEFHADYYLRNNARRLEHLASLGIPIHGRSVLELGAGIGDHTHFYLDRGCKITTTEVREKNLQLLRRRYKRSGDAVTVRRLDLDNPDDSLPQFDLVHCYGLLYHLSEPARALAFIGRHCLGQLVMETVVSCGDESALNVVREHDYSPSQSFHGNGCRPTRRWVVDELKRHFDYVYIPKTQPNHIEFPLDWRDPATSKLPLARSIFVASKTPLNNPLLGENIPDRQEYH